ncbi:hypothetical protein [Streptomyces platensis]|uniref:hypothetical protein n=1 Tax=Streptomyces platensis TaxID=58346 RepID=UPI001FCB887C|nr:hypothetical protein [Streptomyces platensis]
MRLAPPVRQRVRRIPAGRAATGSAPWAPLTSTPDPGQAPGTYDTLIGGLHTRPALIDHQGRQSGIQIGLHPLGARALLGLPAGEPASLDLPAEVVLGRNVQAAGDSFGER